MAITMFAFEQQVFNKALARTKAAVNLWSLKVGAGEVQPGKEYRLAMETIASIEALHPAVATARSKELTEELDGVFEDAFAVLANEFGTLKTMSLLNP